MKAKEKGGKKSGAVKQKSLKAEKTTAKPERKYDKEHGFSILRHFTGLSLSEALRLRKLNKMLSSVSAKNRKQISTQDSITFEKMYHDGICKVKKNYYTKMIQFGDVNYVLLDEDERADVLGLYSQLINYFDPSVKFQIFLFNRHVDEKTLEEQFEIEDQNDKFDDIRDEFSGMLKTLSSKGNNGVIKTKYIIYGIEALNIKEARQRFISLDADIMKNIRNLGSRPKSLDGKERLKVLYEFFNQDRMEPFRFSFKEMAESGNTVKDYIAPQGFEFRYPGRYKMGHMFGMTKYLDIISPKLNDEVLKKLLDIDSNLSVSIHMQTVEPVEAIKLLKRALSDVQKNKIDEQKKAVRSGYDMDILPTDIVLYEKNTMELLDDLNTSNQKLIWTTILISGFGRNRKELENVTQRISGIIQQANCRFIDLQYKQEVAMNAAAPIGVNDTDEGRHFITKNLAVLCPFNTVELFQPGQSLYYGLNALSNNMIMADRKKLRTPNGLILGTPGSGKSFSAKREILGSFLATTDDILVCDPEGEYFPLVKKLGGTVVKLSTDSTDYLNPMDIQLSHKDDREALKIKSDFLITLCDAIAGGEKGLENDEKGIIDRCIEDIYKDYFRDPKPENMPILEDLYNALVRYEPDKALTEELAIDAKQKAVHIANNLVLYVHGSQNYFNHRTNVDSQNRIVCFDIRDLGKQLKELGMLIVQDAVWNRVSRNRERRIATRYYCDEFHLLLRDKQTAQYSVEIWKRFRKWGGIPTGLTQNVTDFLRSDEIEGILGNSDFVYLLNQNARDRAILADKLCLSNEQLTHVTNSEPGSGLILYNEMVIPFVDKYPTDTKTYKLMTTRPQDLEDNSAKEQGDDADGREKK